MGLLFLVGWRVCSYGWGGVHLWVGGLGLHLWGGGMGLVLWGRGIFINIIINVIMVITIVIFMVFMLFILLRVWTNLVTASGLRGP